MLDGVVGLGQSGVALGPRARIPNGLGLVALPQVGDGVVEGVVRVRGLKQEVEAERNLGDLVDRGPTVREGVKADAANGVDVRVVDLGDKVGKRGGEGVVLGEEKLNLERAALIRGILCAGDKEGSRVRTRKDGG